jgi:Zn-dependent metalloprotease
MDSKFEGCVCFAIPPKMFRKLLEHGEGAQADRHMKHSGQLRSLRYEAHYQPPATLARARKLRRSVYDVAGGDTLPGRLVRTEDGKQARDAAANQAFDNAGVALAFWREVFGRNSVDGKGMPVVSTVHYGTGFQNAMWNGRQMVYGDGDATIGGFTEALDIIAHELSHGVTQHIIPGGLGVARIPLKEREFKEQKYTLKGQAGALNESFSDVFASMVKQWHRKQTVDQADWLIGENIHAPMLGRAIRSLKSPGNRKLTWSGDDQIKSFADWHEECDAHDASGIANHAFYSVATKLGGHSWEKAGPIWFEAYDRLHAKATFREAAESTLAVAAERYGPNSAEAKAVKAGWRKVKAL